MLTIMDKEAVRKAFIRNVPYVLSALYATNIGRAWRLAAGSSPSGKILPFLQLLPSALSRFVPSTAPADLLFGAVLGAMLKAAV